MEKTGSMVYTVKYVSILMNIWCAARQSSLCKEITIRTYTPTWCHLRMMGEGMEIGHSWFTEQMPEDQNMHLW